MGHKFCVNLKYKVYSGDYICCYFNKEFLQQTRKYGKPLQTDLFNMNTEPKAFIYPRENKVQDANKECSQYEELRTCSTIQV